MGMNKYKKRNFVLTALSIFFMSCVIFGCTLFNTGSANALKNVPTSTSVNALYNFQDYCYNKSSLDELANQILTEQAPSYQKTISGLVSYATSNAGRNGKPIINKDITVKYGRYRFTETSTTYNDLVWLPVYISSNSKGEAILTLYLAGTETLRGTSQQEQGYFTMQGLYSQDPNIAGPSNSYGTSHMRSISLGASKYDETEKEYKTQPYATYSGGTYRLKEDPTITQANCNKFSDFITGEDFIGAFYEDLATPSEMSWQANESFATYSAGFISNGMSATYANYCWPNEAYGTPASGDYYLPGYFNYTQKNKTQYNAWQNDKVWLPSLTEVGNGDKNPSGGDTTSGIWKLTANQRSNKQVSWLRTAKTDSQKTTDTYNNKYSAYTMFCLDTEGRISESDVSQQCAIRPAIHLNLSKIKDKTTPAVKLPDVVTSTYTGSVQNIDAIPADQRTWYSSGDMTVAFYTDKDCSRGTAPIDAGTYYMMVTLNNSSNRRFFGESADTMYKSTVFVIQKKKLEVKWNYNADSTVASVEYADGTVFEERDKDNIPQLSFYYKSIMNAGDIYYSYPDVMGSYRAHAYILNENMFRYNYELVENARSNQFTVGRRILPLPEFIYSEGVGDKISADRRTLNLSYKGKNFVQIKNISSKMKITVASNTPSALEKLIDLGLNEEKGIQTYMVEDVASYTFTVSLTEKESANAKWESSVGEAVDTSPQSLFLSIDRAVITATFDGLLSSWDTMTDMTFTLGLVGVQAGDDVAMRVYYQPARGGNDTVITPDSNGKYTIPKGRNVGEYTISTMIDSTAQWASGSYKMEQAYTQKFTITQANSSFGQDLVSWQYTVNGNVVRLNDIGAGNTAGSAIELDFVDNYYQFTLQMEEGRLQQYYYVKAEYSDDTYVKDAGLHHVTVTISAYDHNVSFDTQTYVVYFKIKKTSFNMNGVSWDYPGAYQQISGREYEVLLKNVPAGLTVNYSGNKASATGNYSAEAQFVVSEDYANNYEAPESMTLDWAIVESGGVVLSKTDYDTSNVRLLYIHGNKTVTASWDSVQKKWFDVSNNKEFVLTFTYDGMEHVLDLEGYGPDLTIGTNHVNNKYTNAGNYTARFDYTGNPAVYNDLEFATLGWTIAKAEINFDNVRWGYIIGENEYDIDFEVNPFTFTRDENGPVKFTVGLINLPKGVTVNYSTSCLTKPNTAAVRGNSFSETGDYRTSFVRNITFDPQLATNYVAVNAIPTFIPSFQYWTIEDRKFTKPAYDGSWEEFDARTHDLIDLCGMPREELPYFRVEIAFLDGGSNVYNNYEGYDGVPYAAYHAGTYIVRFYELRGDAGTEYPWGSVEINVGKEKLQVVWDSKGSIPVARVTGLYVTEMIGTKYSTDKDGKEEVREQYIKTTDGATFYAAPYLTAEYQNDIEIVMGSNQNSPLEFTYWYYKSTPGKSHQVDKDLVVFRPDKIEYDGTAKTFVLPYWNELSPYLYYEGDSLTQTAVGKYSIDVGFIRYDSSTGAGDAYWAGTEDDRGSIRLTFEITEPTSIALEYPKLESASATYDGNFHKISIVNLAAMNSYITYDVTYEGMNFGQQLTYKAAGNYTITFSFPAGSIGYWKNAPESERKSSYTLTYRIIDPSSSTPLTIPRLRNNTMEETGGPVKFEIENWDSYYNGYCTITEGSLTQTAAGTYTVTVSIKDEFTDLKFANGSRWYILTYTITEGESAGMPSQLALPVVSNPVREYTGAEMSFIDNWGHLSKYVIIVGLDGGLIGQGSYIQEELGDYSFYLRIKDDYKDILPWADDTTTDKLVTFSIVPATVDTSKLGAGADGKVTAPNKDGRDVDFDDYFEYKYFDKEGKEVSADELVDGEEYTVTVSLKNDPAIQKKFNDVFENDEEIRQALTTNNSFTFTYDSGDDDNKMLIIIIIAEVAVVVFLMIATGVVLAIQHKVYDTVDDEYDSYDDYEEDD